VFVDKIWWIVYASAALLVIG